ncbi:UDP-N-acetylmuramoyl-L-alanyl-D-glutamate--2,6-diaminopimelate ligase [Campylobacter suis]|uniref:UDP-N-acetylmuramoyl-L-alanyl-D-glutamate--2,6-diaminopimelate ligase n=1 Tax=Campylobacter suis TaxID=2790657 RepID=A0ABM8Q5B1_9BACT|nr:UDP-N-acetylmuramoyl-L-alanyl-D-glutamate--2,6-diaminopimelate ligase [Campylobacter suis]CAD7287976.1 UDP-N-acetylmuramoyl-L-alanyl-D-glutamate--2, 6-diaminopimelate ligase [Campylobacter suis]
MKIYIDKNFITDNSTECESGCYFLKTNANERFADDAKRKGAEVVDAQQAKVLLGIDQNLRIIGITGTNGKTTTATLIAHALNALGHKTALAGTRGAFIGDERIDVKSLTTAPVLGTLGYLVAATKAKCEFLVMEVSSHAIAQNRIDGLEFALKIFTNLSQDHLDYHGTMDEYARVKNSFLADESIKIINIDDKFVKFNPINATTYSLHNADFSPNSFSLDSGIMADIKMPNGTAVNLHSSLQGEFNLQNLLAAFAALWRLNVASDDKIVAALKTFKGVEGRMQVVSRNPLVIVDFAHTPDGMEKILQALRHKKLVVVFGAGGDRDRTKRPKMGAIAQHYARLAIVTSDNPRSEEPEAIIDEICTGMKLDNSVLREADRAKAIKIGLENLQENEALVILGKGDEDYQEIKSVKHHFSDAEIVNEILKDKK